MIRFVILLAAIVPPLLILGYGIAKARASWKSEAIFNAYFLGAVGAIAAMGLEFALTHVLPLGGMTPVDAAACDAVFIAALPEEAIKFFVLVCLAEKHVDVRRLQDILVLALAVSLGFASLENFAYVVAAGDWKAVAATRAITSIPGHGLDGLAMGTLLIAARMDARRNPELVAYALIVPVILHAAYDFPLFAIEKGIAKIWFIAAWLGVISASSIFVIGLCNHILPEAVEADRAAGRDQISRETTDRLITGGVIAVVGGPLLAVAAFLANGFDVASAATVLSILPIALGIDSILTGVRRRKARLAASPKALDYAR
jgi:RsiW-degrading membrane proteinase PrsW (M82 family)